LPSNCSCSTQGPPKKRKRLLGGGTSDRIELEVGGVQFVAAASTLTANSAYFASLLSRNWSDSNDNEDGREDDRILFLDQDPAPFRILLAYMRRGMIKIEDIDTDVLALAEFLGVERLLLAVKVRWYHNIGRGPVLKNDEEIAVQFDQEYGGILKAISSGLFPYFMKQDDVNAEKVLAAMTIFSPDDDFETFSISIHELGESDVEHGAACLIGALNGLHLKGYTVHETQLDTSNRYEDIITFSRRRHLFMDSDATDIFIPSKDEIWNRTEHNSIKQFAMLLEETDSWNEITIAPAEFVQEGSREAKENPFNVAQFEGRGPWLKQNGFITREQGYEELFQGYIESLLSHNFPRSRREAFRICRIYSRKIKPPQK